MLNFSSQHARCPGCEQVYRSPDAKDGKRCPRCEMVPLSQRIHIVVGMRRNPRARDTDAGGYLAYAMKD